MTERHGRRGTRIDSVGRRRSRLAVRVRMVIALLPFLSFNVSAACRLSLSQASLNSFADRPARYLDRYPVGGKDLTFAVRNFASFNRFGLKGVAAMMRTANQLQKTAIGRGLAGAVNACIPRDAEVARQIADVVKQSADRDIIDAYLEVADDGTSPPTAAAASPDLEGRAQSPVSLDLDQSTAIASPSVPTIALPPKK